MAETNRLVAELKNSHQAQSQDVKNVLDRARIIADDTSVIKQATYFNYQNEYTGSDTKKPQVNLQAFQIHLAHHCNLNCASCYVFSSIADKEFPDFDEMDRDLKRISELTHAEVNEIVVSGGEPLLNKDINDYLTMVRKHFPETNIKLITNGLLIKKMPESFWETCAREDIEFYPTQYRVKVDWDYFRKKCIEHQIRYDMSIIRDNFGFQKLNMDWRGRHNARSMFNSCPYSNRCVALENGNFIPAPLQTASRSSTRSSTCIFRRTTGSTFIRPKICRRFWIFWQLRSASALIVRCRWQARWCGSDLHIRKKNGCNANKSDPALDFFKGSNDYGHVSFSA